MMRKLTFTPESWENFEYWFKNNPEAAKKILILLKECCRSPFDGTGKPQALKHALAGCWSRRISHADRLVYQVTKEEIIIIQLRFNY